ncbi:MAG TPA: tetratricopeptide repeat protein [Rhizomicrobium sp.]|nr:tetratricopeptide repeat protein [Rhizomicrobium sp.]
MRFLDKDPVNLSLLSDAASAAFDEHAFDQAAALIERHAAISPLPPALANLNGVIALSQQRFGDAAAIFADLRQRGADNPALRFNLAWSKAMLCEYKDALDLLDDATVAASPRAPALKIEMMHHLNLYDEALACGQDLAARYPDNQALMGALATLALDAEKPDLAKQYAERAGDNAEGRAALGILTLGEHDTARSLEMFDEALAAQPGNPRAWVGKGLALLISGDTAAGAEAIDKGAELFNDHLGSWVASGWAHFVTGDYAKARASFERALATDPNFSESHGGIAVLDIMQGDIEAARRSAEIALRLDRKSFGGALAKSMLLDKQGNTQMAQKIREIALSTPVGPNGETIAQALVGFSSGLRK